MRDTTVGQITRKVAGASTIFENTNTELKRKYLIWNIEAFKIIASRVSTSMGSFGTGYPFYALDKDLQGTLPIIPEQIRYNRKLVEEGEQIQKSIWECKSCMQANSSKMLDLKGICRPCPNIISGLKPRKIINRLPDLDLWIICQDGCIEQTQEELSILLEKQGMHTSDIDPIRTINEVETIAKMLKEGKIPTTFLPIDAHIMEYSEMKELIAQVPEVLRESKKKEKIPYLPIHPKSYRKQWQYDDEAYNFIYDFLSAFTEFDFPEELQQAVNASRLEIANSYVAEELFKFLLQSATEANYRRFQTPELRKIFLQKVRDWRTIDISARESTKLKDIDQDER